MDNFENLYAFALYFVKDAGCSLHLVMCKINVVYGT